MAKFASFEFLCFLTFFSGKNAGEIPEDDEGEIVVEDVDSDNAGKSKRKKAKKRSKEEEADEEDNTEEEESDEEEEEEDEEEDEEVQMNNLEMNQKLQDYIYKAIEERKSKDDYYKVQLCKNPMRRTELTDAKFSVQIIE